METEDNVIDELVREIAGLIHEYPKVLERRAADIHASGKDPELGADTRQGCRYHARQRKSLSDLGKALRIRRSRQN